MDRDVLVPFLKAVVLADVMQVVTSDNDGPLHLHFGHHTCSPPKNSTVSLKTWHMAEIMSIFFVFRNMEGCFFI